MYMKEYMHTNVITVDSDTLINDAEKLMREHKMRRLPVVDKGKLVGIVTRDKIREATTTPSTSLSVWELNYLLSKMKVKDLMEKRLYTVTPDTTVEQAVSEAQKRGFGTILVVDKGKPDKLVGIATTTDLYRVATAVLGFGQAGVRLHIFDWGKKGSAKEAIDIINKSGANILSMFCVTPPGIGREDCIIHLDKKDATQLVNELKSKGYEVEARPR